MVRITIKPLSGGTFQLDAENTDSIAALKQKITELKGHPTAQQKIIFSGKILTDDKTIQECNIKEKDFLVVMVSKPKPAPAPPATTTSNAESSSSSTAAATAPSDSTATPASTTAESTPAPASAPAPATAAAAAAAAPVADQPMGTSFLSGPALESAVQNLVEMSGSTREEVMRAMRAAFNNPDRAYEYLLTGIPESANAPAAAGGAGAGAGAGATGTPATPARAATTGTAPSAPTAQRTGNLFEAAAAAAGSGGAGGAGAGAGGAGAGGLAAQLSALRRQAGAAGGAGGAAGGPDSEELAAAQQMLGNPAMMEQLRQLIVENPAALQPLMQQIAQANPALAQAMENDPQEVMNRLRQMMGPLLGGEGGEEGLDELMGEDFGGEGQQVQLTEEDRGNIEQITAMGIPEERAIMSYLMCGRNVEMAIQYYFENSDDFEEGS
ncbi:unnamed protein product [Tilletia laevis]|uniref:UV excision repair protein RAD23 n=3 Tax=Tilletia TaxID=13289 RepID=A0A8X7MLI5_9BASI|nr:hypothetical protein CF336_g6956 [Tilletia laevis]KAE8187802.1 hypothetical protein CF328_g6801 [Tilletia controversa]KAE8250069.1 hypothetical protein A4X03_0g6522 [Tilletia caries]KAE8189779.1 hypothetical protein CF335_g6534 [Tilletia laevis]KAE8241288.1 hypothetical protein A4X06_0g7591 [Tilletia controversa]